MITLLSKSNCSSCKMTKRVLTEREIPFEERMMDQDDSALALAKELGYLQAPVVLTATGEHWSGFRPDLINNL